MAKAPSLQDALNAGRWACESYVNWYGNGMAHDAPNVAYELLSALRLLMAETESAQSGWISVKERLPEFGQSVALVNIGRWENCGGDMDRNCHDAGYLKSGALGLGTMSYWCVRGERAQNLHAYTHWMLLPEPPQDGSPATGGVGK